MNKSADKEPKNFESALSELESIIDKMEKGDLQLEKSLATFKRGSQLIQYCQDQIKKVEEQIKIYQQKN